ncbi:hypothetical protein GCM10010215_60230 [Streptomyces virginiae]|uniref:AB hydrolase-1 domain-containing protein n=1 Tax=Streptomyces virginiae TaxID=1961 RepID=A0ABQ3NV67_STRVG|nr:alpha/beta hydrolase [Streptomyces virginiae]MBP2344992.1 hypothetical protein [Streptomyces virginiae]GGQ27958.1 hypothetical protein GCM10010215_60230 [Streptomyces virginiae]GHI16643.1 hypothetical protein Scinn_61060 [Streptomyces virginiae]
MTTTWTLADLEAAIRAGWSAETCEPADISRVPWTPENPAWGQCDITALVVQDLVGGDLVLGEVFHEGRQEGYHWWNLLPGGIRVDLTREQFRRGETVTPGRVVKRPGGRLKRRWEEYQLLRQRVIDKLGPLPGVMVAQDGRRLAYTDFGGPGAPLLEHVGLGPAVVLGHSLGGVNAYQLAARRPDLVRAVVVEDIGAVVDGDLSFARAWPRRATTRAGFLAGLGSSAPYLEGAVREYPDGWGTAFEVEDMVESQRGLNGDHWGDWLRVRTPTLLVRGDRSGVLSAEHAREMTVRRAGVRLVELPAGHAVRVGDPEGYFAAVRGFLARVGRGAAV